MFIYVTEPGNQNDGVDWDVKIKKVDVQKIML